MVEGSLAREIIFQNNRKKWNTPVKIGNTIRKVRKMEWKYMVIRRGDIVYADLRPVIGSEQGGVDRCLLYRMMLETGTVLP